MKSQDIEEMPEHIRDTLKRDVKIWTVLAVMEKTAVAYKFFSYAKDPVRALNAWLVRVRKRLIESQWYWNNALSITKRDRRMRKILLSDKIGVDLLKEGEVDEDE